jgi:RNA polymerase sigma-70 factor (ECF subfamily)
VEAHSGEVTRLLAELSKKDPEAEAKLIPLVYDHLHRLAAIYIRGERPDHTLQATGLVNEAYLRLVSQGANQWRDRAHFFGIAARLMRQILVEHARAKHAAKRGGTSPIFVPLGNELDISSARSRELVELDDALRCLERLDPQQAQIVELRFFGGMTVEETAEVLGISPRTVKRDWAVARAWLHGELVRNDGTANESSTVRPSQEQRSPGCPPRGGESANRREPGRPSRPNQPSAV